MSHTCVVAGLEVEVEGGMSTETLENRIYLKHMQTYLDNEKTETQLVN